MNWTRPADLRAQLQKQWDRGALLAATVSGESQFPLRLALRGPSSAELTYNFEAARRWIAELAEMPHCRLEMREFRHRVFGANAVPVAAWIDTLDDAARLLGKRQEFSRFAALLASTRERQPLLVPWLAKRPLRALELHDQWARLLDLVGWLQAHPRPGIYLRQVDLAGIHSKFVEANRAVLTEWLDLTLPSDAIDPTCSGVGKFAGRYGFLDKPLRVRFRILDDAKAILPGMNAGTDVTLDAQSFARLNPTLTRIFITENEINFLAFPPFPDSMVIFGSGYGFSMLADVAWLQDCRMHYWGDIDTHGFAILDQLRHLFGHVDSFLMDRATLMAFHEQWSMEDTQLVRDLARLRPDEQALYDDLRDNRLGGQVRLEQERIAFGSVEAAMRSLSDPSELSAAHSTARA